MKPIETEADAGWKPPNDERKTAGSPDPTAWATSQSQEEPEIHSSFVQGARNLASHIRRREEQFAKLMRITERINCGVMLEEVLDFLYEEMQETTPSRWQSFHATVCLRLGRRLTMNKSTSRNSIPPYMAAGPTVDHVQCPCALRALDLCLTDATYMKTDDSRPPRIYWERQSVSPAETTPRSDTQNGGDRTGVSQ